MIQHENDLEQYLYEIGELIPSSKAEKEQFLANFAEDIVRCEEEACVEATYDWLVSYFGEPSSIAQEYTSVWKEDFIETTTNGAVHNHWKTVILFICIILLLVCMIYSAYDTLRALFEHDGAHFYATHR